MPTRRPKPSPAPDATVVPIGRARSRRGWPTPEQRREARVRLGPNPLPFARAAGVDLAHYLAFERGAATLPAHGFAQLTAFVGRLRAVSDASVAAYDSPGRSGPSAPRRTGRASMAAQAPP